MTNWGFSAIFKDTASYKFGVTGCSAPHRNESDNVDNYYAIKYPVGKGGVCYALRFAVGVR